MNVVHLPSDRRPRGTRDHILEAARVIFMGDGNHRFSMRRLAAMSGCAVGTIYVYFKSKEEVIRAVVEQSFARLFQALSGLMDRHRNGDPVILLKKGLYTYVEFGLRNPNDYRLAFSSPQQHGVQPTLEMIRSMVRRCVDEHRFRRADDEIVAQGLWAAIHGITSVLIQTQIITGTTRAKVIEQVINSAVDNLLVAPLLASAREAG